MPTMVSEKPVSSRKQHVYGVEQQYLRAKFQIRLLDIITIGLTILLASIVYLTGIFLVHRAVEIPSWIRIGEWVFYLLGVLLTLYYFLLRPTRRSLNPFYVAKRVESLMENSKNSVINWVDLSDHEEIPLAFRQAIATKATSDLNQIDLDKSFEKKPILWLMGICGFALSLMLITAFLPPLWTRIELLKPQEGNITVFSGQDVAFVVKLDGRIPKAPAVDAPRIRIRYNPEDPESYEDRFLEPDQEEKKQFAITIPSKHVRQGFYYQILAGNAATPEYQLICKILPLFESFDVQYQFPEYVNQKPEPSSDPNLLGYYGSKVTLLAHTNQDAQSGYIELTGQNAVIPAQLVKDDPRLLKFEFPLEIDQITYRIHFVTKEGQKNDPPSYRMNLLDPVPSWQNFNLTYRYPAYLRWKVQEVVKQKNPEIEAMRGTNITIQAHANRPIREAHARFPGLSDTLNATPVMGNPSVVEFHLPPLEQDGNLEVWFYPSTNEKMASPKFIPIHVRVDHSPEVVITKPTQAEIQLPANGTLEVDGYATDDFGVKSMSLQLEVVSPVGQKLKAKPFRSGKDFMRQSDRSFPTKLEYKDSISLEKLQKDTGEEYPAREGIVIEYWLEATDNCDVPGPNKGISKKQRIRVLAPLKQEQQKKQQQQQQNRKQEEQQQQQNQDQQNENEKRDPKQPQPKQEQDQNQQGNPDQNQQGNPDKNQQGNPDKNQQGNPDKNQQGNPDKNQQGNPDKNQQGNPDKNQQGNPDKNQQGNPDKNQQGNPDKNSSNPNQRKDNDLDKKADELNKNYEKQKQEEKGTNKEGPSNDSNQQQNPGENKKENPSDSNKQEKGTNKQPPSNGNQSNSSSNKDQGKIEEPDRSREKNMGNGSSSDQANGQSKKDPLDGLGGSDRQGKEKPKSSDSKENNPKGNNPKESNPKESNPKENNPKGNNPKDMNKKGNNSNPEKKNEVKEPGQEKGSGEKQNKEQQSSDPNKKSENNQGSSGNQQDKNMPPGSPKPDGKQDRGKNKSSPTSTPDPNNPSNNPESNPPVSKDKPEKSESPSKDKPTPTGNGSSNSKSKEEPKKDMNNGKSGNNDPVGKNKPETKEKIDPKKSNSAGNNSEKKKENVQPGKEKGDSASSDENQKNPENVKNQNGGDESKEDKFDSNKMKQLAKDLADPNKRQQAKDELEKLAQDKKAREQAEKKLKEMLNKATPEEKKDLEETAKNLRKAVEKNEQGGTTKPAPKEDNIAGGDKNNPQNQSNSSNQGNSSKAKPNSSDNKNNAKSDPGQNKENPGKTKENGGKKGGNSSDNPIKKGPGDSNNPSNQPNKEGTNPMNPNKNQTPDKTQKPMPKDGNSTNPAGKNKKNDSVPEGKEKSTPPGEKSGGGKRNDSELLPSKEDPPELADLKNKQRGGELQLEKFKQDGEKIRKANNYTKEQWDDFLKSYEQSLKNRNETLKEMQKQFSRSSGSSSLNGSESIKLKPMKGQDPLRNSKFSPPPDFSDSYNKFTKEVSGSKKSP